jgi:hypothetical protein
MANMFFVNKGHTEPTGSKKIIHYDQLTLQAVKTYRIAQLVYQFEIGYTVPYCIIDHFSLFQRG